MSARKLRAESPLDHLEWLLEVVSVLPRQDTKYLWLYKVSTIFFTICTFVGPPSDIIYLLQRHHIVKKAANVQILVTSSKLGISITNFKLNMNLWRSIINMNREIWQEMASNPQNEKLLKEIWREGQKVERFIRYFYIAAFPLSIMPKLLQNLKAKNPKHRDVFFNFWDPIGPIFGEDYIWTRCLYQTFFWGYGTILYGVVTSAIYLTCHMVSGQMRVLIRMLESEDINVEQCVRLHQKNLIYFKKVREMFSGQMYVEMASFAVKLSARAYQMLQILKFGGAPIGSTIILFVILFCAPFTVCYCGHIINEMSEKLYRSSYQNHWYKLSIKDQKSLSLLMTQATRIVDMDYRGMMKFNMQQFGSVCQTSYSCLTVILGMLD